MSEFDVLAQVVEITHSKEAIQSKIDKVINYLKDKLDLNGIHLLLFKEDENMFLINYSSNNELVNQHKWIPPDDPALFDAVTAKRNVFIDDLRPGADFDSELIDHASGCNAMFALPICNSDSFIGVMLGEKHGELTKLDEKLLSLISIEITGMIYNESNTIKLKEKIHELSTSFSISKLFIKNDKLDDLCNKMVEHISTLLYSNTVMLELFAQGTGTTVQKYVFNKDKVYDLDGALIQGIIDETKRRCRPTYIKDASTDARCSGSDPDFRSALFAPVEYNSDVIGIIALFDKEANLFVTKKHFSEDDFNILISMTNQLANFVENLLMTKERESIIKEKEDKASELKILYDVSKAMMTTMKLDDLLQKILTAVTISGGLGFNRAGLFLINHRMNTLQGMLCIGPDTGEEADAIWTELKKEEKTLLQWITPDLSSGSRKRSQFDEKVKSIRIPLDEEENAMIRAIDQKKAVMVTNGSYLSNKAISLDSTSYAVVPLISKDKVIGVIVVDNSITKQPITSDDLSFLTLFSNQAGLAIENSTLYSNLKKTLSELKDTHSKLLHSEKLAALGEMAAGVAHEIKNPLMAIGGFARRLDKRFAEDSPDKTYINIIIKEVSRLEKILNEILNFSKEERENNFALNDINKIINETLIMFDNEMLENNITTETNLNYDLPMVLCNYQQVKQAVINLVNNSCQAMPRSGKLSVTTRKSLVRNKDSVVIEISDTGGGVNNEVLHNIFNPFFTTKDGGTGLGLAITHRFIANHSGSIEVDNKPGLGVTFIINLPVKMDEEE